MTSVESPVLKDVEVLVPSGGSKSIMSVLQAVVNPSSA
jgi:hypothetical protein